MYCIKCGVELSDSEEKCPLCGTVVFHPYIKRPDGEKKREKHRLRAHLVLVWLFSLLILYLCLAKPLRLPLPEAFRYPLSAAVMQLILLLPVIILCRDVFTGGWKSLIHFAPNMYTLVALGAGTSAAYSLFELVVGAWKLSSGMAHELSLIHI